MGGVSFFDFRDLRFEIDSNVFFDHFGEEFGVENRPQIMKKSCENDGKKHLDFNMIF